MRDLNFKRRVTRVASGNVSGEHYREVGQSVDSSSRRARRSRRVSRSVIVSLVSCAPDINWDFLDRNMADLHVIPGADWLTPRTYGKPRNRRARQAVQFLFWPHAWRKKSLNIKFRIKLIFERFWCTSEVVKK